MTDVNELLAMVENPTRRKILESLAREPHYPLQLSKELGVSQPAIVKNLNLLEEHGMVAKHQEDSDIGPKRTIYTLNYEFTLVMDMRNGMFRSTVVYPSDSPGESEDVHDLRDARTAVADIDRRIEELEDIRSGMIRRREALIRGMLDAMPRDMLGYRHRSLLYGMLNEPRKDVRALIKDMEMNNETAKEMIDNIENILKED